MVAPALWGDDQTLEFGLPQQQPLRKGYECRELIWEVVPGSSCRGARERERERCVHKIIAMGDWS